MKKSDLYREWARVLDMCEGTAVKPEKCFYVDGFKGCIAVCPQFNKDPNTYNFAVAILEDKPVFVGDTLYHMPTGASCTVEDRPFVKGFPEMFSWNPTKKKNPSHDERNFVEYLLDHELQEIDTLTVSNLRPMCDAKDFEDVIAYKKFGEKSLGFIVYRADDGLYYSRENTEIVYKDYQLIGYIPMPVYKPELTGDGEKTAG